MRTYCESSVTTRFPPMRVTETFRLTARISSSRRGDTAPHIGPILPPKASADLFVLAYRRTYGLPVTISRSNNYGPLTASRKPSPLMISRALADEGTSVYGTSENVRDWLHVSDHCRAIGLIIHEGRVGELYNVSGLATHKPWRLSRRS